MGTRTGNLFIVAVLLNTLASLQCDSNDTRYIVNGREIPNSKEALAIIKRQFESYLYKNSIGMAYDVGVPSVKILTPSDSRKDHFDMKLAFTATPQKAKNKTLEASKDWRGERNNLYCTVFIKKLTDRDEFVGRSTKCLPAYKYELMDHVYLHATSKAP